MGAVHAAAKPVVVLEAPDLWWPHRGCSWCVDPLVVDGGGGLAKNQRGEAYLALMTCCCSVRFIAFVAVDALSAPRASNPLIIRDRIWIVVRRIHGAARGGSRVGSGPICGKVGGQ